MEPKLVVLARLHVEPLTGAVTLHLIRDTDPVELHEGDEFVTVGLMVNPFPEVP